LRFSHFAPSEAHYNNTVNVINVIDDVGIYQLKENKMVYTLDTKVGDILKDARAVKILEKYAPGVAKNPMIGLAKGMTLKTLLSLPQAKKAGITEEMVLKVLAEINAIK
jgi:hypothetical protein